MNQYSPKIPIKLTARLKEILSLKEIDPKKYGPAYGGESAGLDLYYTGEKSVVITGSTMYYKGDDPTRNMRVLLSVGVHIAVPPMCMAKTFERGSVTKTNIVNRAGVIDSGYTDELFVSMASLSEGFIVNPGDKLPIQLIVVPILNNYTVVEDEEYDKIVAKSKRKYGALGSSDKE